MELLGPSLEKVFKDAGRKFLANVVTDIGIQLLKLIETLHTKNYIHRDIKPENFVIGLNDNVKSVYMIDFGLAKAYRNVTSGLHIPYRDNRSFTGTARYASVNTHIGIEQSRRDDIEAFIYILVYFFKGSLPWQGIKGHTKREKQQKVMEHKMATPIELLCKEMPKEFTNLLYYARKLRFEEEPDYKFIRRMLLKMLNKGSFRNELMLEKPLKVRRLRNVLRRKRKNRRRRKRKAVPLRAKKSFRQKLKN
eukprot:TRINITY_DN2902_c0_g3_i1.p1 TRINITY_DN2902_c0_g3~~TRINITY_DN2902_c0_g3_i1.p1  ORF type:complete len:250 (-),score=53.26 TRINITY_DN2902_c0_g3_i1:251-1000(-)